MKGIDISNYQGNVNFAEVKASGVEIVILKSTEGRTWKDDKFSTYYANAVSAGLKVGVYHYLRNNSSEDEIANFLSVVENRKFDCKVAIDMEEDFGSVSQNSKRVRGFADILISKGYEVCIYSGEYFYRDRLDNSVKDLAVWIAHYGVSKPDVSNYAGHQYSETGRVTGVNGNVDMNNFTDGILAKGCPNNGNITPPCNNTYGEITASTLNVRKSSNVNSEIIGTLKKGEKVRIDERQGDWYSIFYGSHGGFISADYVCVNGSAPAKTIVNPSIPKTGIVTTNTLNVRSGAGTGYAIIGQLNQGDRVQIARKVGNFYETYFGDHGGWVSADYIK